MSKRLPNPTDVIVGRNIGNFRLESGLTISELAQRVGVSRTQMESYESAVTRVPTSRLVRVADVLNIPAATLFDGGTRTYSSELEQFSPPCLPKPDALRLRQAFNNIPGKRMRRAVLRFLEEVANA